MRTKKQRIAIMLVTASLGLANAGVQAQGTVAPPPGRTSETPRDASYQKDTENRTDYSKSSDMKPGHIKASKLIGMKVTNDQGERLGKVEDLIIDSNHNVKFAVIASGGAVGIGEKHIAVPINELKCAPDHTARLSTTADEFKNLSKTPTGPWAGVSGEEWTRNIDGYYGHPQEFSITQRRGSSEPSRTYERETVDFSLEREPVRTVQGAGARDLITHPEHADLFNEPLIGSERTDNNRSSFRTGTALTSDEATQQRVCESLRQSYPARTPESVSVTVQDSVVTLRGTVANATEKKNIETTVKQMSGVRRVNNQLTVQNR